MSRRANMNAELRRRIENRAEDMSELPTNALSKLPPAPRHLPTATPPCDGDDAFDDLAREMCLHIALVRCRREQRGGIMSSRLNAALSLDLPDDWIAPLARGVAMPVSGREWTAPMVAVHVDLPLATWIALRDAAHAWRLERLRLAPAGFSLATLPDLEAQLPPLAARLMNALLLEQAGNDLNLVIERSGYGVCSDLEDWANCLGEERAERSRSDLKDVFGPDGAAIRLGVFEAPSTEDRSVSVNHWEPVLNRSLVSTLLGEPIESLSKKRGVTVVRPSERLADVVLSPHQRRLVDGIDMAWPTQAGAGNALAILLHGPSGTGKTLLARALAGERGVPLVLLDGAHVEPEHRYPGDEVDPPAARIAGLVRRAANERAILFIDEADDLLRDGSEASRAFLIALERHPAVVLLATNKPLSFDPALDRRLQIKIHMDIPGPEERTTILRKELARSGVTMVPGLLDDDRLALLASSSRLSGGHWRSVVQVAGMLAGTRGNAAGTPVTLEDLADALRLQVADEQVVDASRATRVRWIDRPRAADLTTWGTARMERFTSLAQALNRLRIDPRPGHVGFGAVLVVHGPDSALAAELGEALAAALHLPLARVGDWRLNQGRHGGTEENDETTTAGPLGNRGGWSGPRRSETSLTRTADRERSGGMTWNERDIAALLHDLGGCSAVHLTLADPDAAEESLPLIEALAVSQHVAVVHLREGAIAPELRRRAAVVLPWAVIDPVLRNLRWAALGGRGAPPQASAIAELTAAATRERLTAAGFSSDVSGGALP